MVQAFQHQFLVLFHAEGGVESLHEERVESLLPLLFGESIEGMDWHEVVHFREELALNVVVVVQRDVGHNGSARDFVHAALQALRVALLGLLLLIRVIQEEVVQLVCVHVLRHVLRVL